MLRALKGWRAVIVNSAAGLFIVLPTLISYFTTVNWNEYLPPDYARWVILGMAILNIYIRVVHTTTPVGKTTLDGQP